MTRKGDKQKRHRLPGIHRKVTKSGEVRWQASIDMALPGAPRKQLRQTFATQADAVDWRNEMLARKRRGELIQPSTMPLSDWFGEWLATKAPRVRAGTVAAYRTWFGHVRDDLGGLPLSRITPSALERAYNRLSATMAPASVRSIHRLLSMLLGAAVRDGLIPRNVAKLVEAPGGPPAPRASWTLEQAKAFIASLDNGYYDVVWRFVLETWLRAGEVRALRWSDLDLHRGTVTVRRTATLGADGRSAFGPPKTRTSIRTLGMSPGLAERLREGRAAAIMAAQTNGEHWTDDELVFRAEGGGVLHSNQLGQALRAACDRAGVPYIGVHGLRHTGGSLAVNSGAPITAVSERLGHANANITWAVYMHADEDQAARLGEVMGQLLVGSGDDLPEDPDD